jgi:O-antigen/teichoic acid export membrane protein
MYADLTRHQLLRRFFSNAGLYGISIVIPRLGALILLPLYWTKLSPSDFGVIGVALVVSTLLAPILGFGLPDAAQRLYAEWSERERAENVFLLLAASTVVSASVCAALDAFGATLFARLFEQVQFNPYLRLAIWIAFCGNMSLIPMALLRIQERIALFSLLTLGSFATQAAVGIYLVLVAEQGPAGYLRAMLIANALWAAVSVGVVARRAKVCLAFERLGTSVRYGFPTALVLLIESLGGALDRYFLDKYVPLALLGLYNLGYQLGSGFGVFNQALKASWFPFLYRAAAERTDMPQVLGRFSVIYVAVLAIPALALALLGKEFIDAFGGQRYQGVYPLLPMFVLVYYVQAVIAAMGRGMDLAKRMASWPLAPALGVVVNLACLPLLVPRFGVWGALAALLLANLTRAAVQIGLAVYHYPRPLHFEALLSIWGLTGLAFAAGLWFSPHTILASALFKVIIVSITAPALLWLAAGRPNIRQAWLTLRSRGAR